MNETKILRSTTAKQEFKLLNDSLEKIISSTPSYKVDEVYGEEFGKIFDRAVEGDLVAQDYLGYIFKRGKRGLVPENIELSMSWQILAAANGNQYTIERLAIFLNSAFDSILGQEDVEYMSYAIHFNKTNYQYVLGKLVCEAICDELQINEHNIITDVPDTILYNSSTMYKYDQAKVRATQVVIDYLRKSYLNMKQFEHLKKQKEYEEIKQQEEPQNEEKSFLTRLFKKRNSTKENKNDNTSKN